MRRLWERLRQGYRTIDFPKGHTELSPRFRGPARHRSLSLPGWAVIAVPTPAQLRQSRPIPCGWIWAHASSALPAPGRVARVPSPRPTIFGLATRTRDDLVLSGREMKLATSLDRRMRKIFGRSLKLRQVSAGGCNACEADLNVTGIVVFDIGRFGIQFVASPRHADGIVVTGPVTTNMALALRETYIAVPEPKLVIAAGRLRHQGRPVCRLIRLRGRHPRRHSCGPLPSRLPAPPAHHSRWIAAPPGPHRGGPLTASY